MTKREALDTLKRMLRNKFFVVGAFVVLSFVMLALLAPCIVAHPAEKANLYNRLLPPEGFANGWKGYILGTDPMGQDILTRLLIGSRYSLVVAFSTVSVSAAIGIVLGIVSGYYGGMLDNLIMRFGDIQLSIPAMVLAVAVVAVLGPNLRNLILVLIITSWIQYARVVRSKVLTIRDMEFVKASVALGASDGWIMFRQIFPNVLTPLFILISQQLGFMILMEAGLSFLGLGVPPPTPSWGVMISDGREYIATAPWVVLAPGITLMIAVLGFNFLGDGLRDVLDPKMRK